MHKIIKSDVYLKSHEKAFLWFDVDDINFSCRDLCNFL